MPDLIEVPMSGAAYDLLIERDPDALDSHVMKELPAGTQRLVTMTEDAYKVLLDYRQGDESVEDAIFRRLLTPAELRVSKR